jgi:hypothetical protein
MQGQDAILLRLLKNVGMTKRSLMNQKERTTEVLRGKMMLRNIGGAKRDRTADLLNAIQALSQLSYSPSKRRP